MADRQGSRPAARGEIWRRFRPLLLDVIAPIAVYYGLEAAGVGDLPAVLAGGGIAAADALVTLAVERRLRWLPLYVCAMFAITGALAVATHDPRVVLVKPSIASLAVGLYLLAIAIFPRLLDAALRPLIARASPERAARWQRAWQEDAMLRRELRLASALAGLLLLAEAAARAAIVFSVSIGEALVLMHVPAVIVIVALVLIVRFMIKPAVIRAMAAKSP